MYISIKLYIIIPFYQHENNDIEKIIFITKIVFNCITLFVEIKYNKIEISI